jgi:MFS family permease
MACARYVRAGFITGSLIARYGVNRIVALGLAMLLVSALVGIAGLTVAHFWISLTLLGVGWNFASSARPPSSRAVTAPRSGPRSSRSTIS